MRFLFVEPALCLRSDQPSIRSFYKNTVHDYLQQPAKSLKISTAWAIEVLRILSDSERRSETLNVKLRPNYCLMNCVDTLLEEPAQVVTALEPESVKSELFDL